MYIYQIGYGSYEDSGSIELSHTRKIAEDELQTMFVEATLELLLNRRDNLMHEEEGVVSEHDLEFHEEIYNDNKEGRTHYKTDRFDGRTLEEYLEEQRNDPRNFDYTRFSEIYSAVADIMIERYDFEKIKYEQKVFVWGWEAIVGEHTWTEDRGQSSPILSRIKEEFWKRKKLYDNPVCHCGLALSEHTQTTGCGNFKEMSCEKEA